MLSSAAVLVPTYCISAVEDNTAECQLGIITIRGSSNVAAGPARELCNLGLYHARLGASHF